MADVDPEAVRRQREMALATITKHTAGEPDHRVPDQDTWARVAKIGVPVLAVHGGLDSDDHLRMADRLVRSVPGARAVTVDGAAHYPGMERPAVYNAFVSEFLRTV
ncbi:alpha/beta hydrolase [Streptomyces sp. NPDC052610]|uniref:alpha/beta fold hydrolase n=1 Tax=Streptomyces sp. NPDC052610 TaxID=3154952 RepID=UPI003441360E